MNPQNYNGQSYQGNPYQQQGYNAQNNQGQYYQPGSAQNPYANGAYQGTGYGYGPQYAMGGQNQPVPSRPDNYLVWAILTTLCCCLPFGIVAIVYASKVNDLYNAGQFQAAYQASSNAKKWAIISAICGVAVCVIYVLYFVIVGGAALASLDSIALAG